MTIDPTVLTATMVSLAVGLYCGMKYIANRDAVLGVLGSCFLMISVFGIIAILFKG